MDSFSKSTRELREEARGLQSNLQLASKVDAALDKLASKIRDVMRENRQSELRQRNQDLIMGAQMSGDIKSTVIGEWVKLEEDGTGIVSYRDKNYKTVPLKMYSTRGGKKVEMIYDKGVYYTQL